MKSFLSIALLKIGDIDDDRAIFDNAQKIIDLNHRYNQLKFIAFTLIRCHSFGLGQSRIVKADS
jgi:hypothetical protein